MESRNFPTVYLQTIAQFVPTFPELLDAALEKILIFPALLYDIPFANTPPPESQANPIRYVLNDTGVVTSIFVFVMLTNPHCTLSTVGKLYIYADRCRN